jgi:hypothetical protein
VDMQGKGHPFPCNPSPRATTTPKPRTTTTKIKVVYTENLTDPCSLLGFASASVVHHTVVTLKFLG